MYLRKYFELKNCMKYWTFTVCEKRWNPDKELKSCLALMQELLHDCKIPSYIKKWMYERGGQRSYTSAFSWPMRPSSRMWTYLLHSQLTIITNLIKKLINHHEIIEILICFEKVSLELEVNFLSSLMMRSWKILIVLALLVEAVDEVIKTGKCSERICSN